MSSNSFQVRPTQALPNDFSDGQEKTWPGPPYSRGDDTAYRRTLANMWLENRGSGVKWSNHIYERLPTGYRLFQVPKSDSSSVVYKRLFGHPSRRYFDSMKKFFPHFSWLMDGGQGTCQCTLCSKGELRVKAEPKSAPLNISLLESDSRDIPPEMVTARTRPRTEERVDTDEEGIPDPYKPLSRKLQRVGRVNDSIKENASLDWRAEREVLGRHLARIRQQHSFLPRVGELVLWTPEMEGDLVRNENTGQYQLYCFEAQRYRGFPVWMAGTVTEVPEKADDFPDLVKSPTKQNGVNISGYKVETFPDPNNILDKSLSKRYKYIPLRQIRPLSYWQTLLHGLDEQVLHPSVKNALTVFTSLSVLGAFKFRGVWPNAEVFCKGIFLGPELLTVGDAVRILPKDGKADCSEILVITSIRLKFHNIVPDSPARSENTSIRLYGRAYTTKPPSPTGVPFAHQPLSSTDAALLFPMVGMSSLGKLYPMHSSSELYEVSYDRVLGRLHEPSATCLWLNMSVDSTLPSTILSHDIPAVNFGRLYGRQTDARIPNEGSWFLADTRAHALALETFNGIEVHPYDEGIRNEKALKEWRIYLKILDGTATQQDLDEVVIAPMEGKKRGRKPGARVLNGKVVYPNQPGYEEAVSGGIMYNTKSGTSKMVNAAFASDDDEDETDYGRDATYRAMQGVRTSIEVREHSPRAHASSDSNEEDQEVSSNDDELILPPHVERGGTEETEGGDYTPMSDT